MRSIGIVGAGKLGTALAQSALEAGLEVTMTSRNTENTVVIAEVMAPGAKVAALDEVARAEVVVLALPLHRLRDLPPGAFDGKLVIDAVNYWEPVDGPVEKFGVGMAETSQLVQSHFANARVVKSLNQLGYHDVEEGRRPAGSADRLGVAMAGDAQAKATVSALIERLGFDPVDAGSLADGKRLGPGGPAFGTTLTAKALKKALGL